MKFRIPLLLLALAPASAFAFGNDCRHKADRAGGVDARGLEKVAIRTGAGDMKVVGNAAAVRVEARGVACANSQSALDKAQISVRREGNVAIVETLLPQDAGDDSIDDDRAWIDIGIALPDNLPVEAMDSSGDARFQDLKQLTLQDSSGELEIERIAGLVDVSDSSGDLEIEEAGSVRVRDSSGDVEIENIRGDVEIELDSSGDIRVSDVSGSARVRQDSSGSMRFEDVKGDVEVDSDSSGDIHAKRVGGNFTVKEDSSGSIGHEAIGGRITVPDNKRED